MWVISKRKHFCGFDSLFCGHCLGRNISNFGLLHLYKKKKRWEIQKVLAMVKSLLRACSQSLAGPTGSPGLLAASCAGAGGLPALWRLGTGCPPLPPPPCWELSRGWGKYSPTHCHAWRAWEGTHAAPAPHPAEALSLPCKPEGQELAGWAGDSGNQPVLRV